MSDNSMNMILANWVYSKVCKSCREAGGGHGFSEHEDWNNQLVGSSWLLGKRDGEGGISYSPLTLPTISLV